MELQTKLGAIKVKKDDIIRFPTGILGFSEFHNYVVIDQKDSYFSFLQSVEEPSLTFMILMPELVCCEYSVKLNSDEIALLQISSPDDGKVYAIVTVPENVADMTVNLQAPVVINTKKKLGAQIIVTENSYHTKHNVLAEMHKNVFLLEKQRASQQEAKEIQESV